MNEHTCTKVEDIAELRQKVKNIAQTQGRHEGSIDKIESECRSGRRNDMKEVEEKFKDAREGMDDKFDKVLDAVAKSRTANFRMMLTVVGIFGALFSIIAIFLSQGNGQGLPPLP